MSKRHAYNAQVIWDGNLGEDASTYTSYGRQYRIVIDGKPQLQGSADPMFRGDAGVHNPEDLFLGAVSACHMLTYLALCARQSIRVVSYSASKSRGVIGTTPSTEPRSRRCSSR